MANNDQYYKYSKTFALEVLALLSTNFGDIFYHNPGAPVKITWGQTEAKYGYCPIQRCHQALDKVAGELLSCSSGHRWRIVHVEGSKGFLEPDFSEGVEE